METYLKPLAEKIKTLLPNNTYFTLDDSEQSFMVYPTNHINLHDDFISIEVATVVYNTIKEHNTILKHLSKLYRLVVNFSDTVEDYASVNPLSDGTIRLNWGGVYIDQGDKDFDDILDLLNYLKIYS